MSTPFEVHRGTLQMRRESSEAPEGSHVFELGHALHLDVNLDAGDLHEVEHSFTRAGQAACVRARIRARAHAEAPPGMTWVVTARLNGVVHYRRELQAGREVVIADAAVRMAPAFSSPTPNVIAFRLELE